MAELQQQTGLEPLGRITQGSPPLNSPGHTLHKITSRLVHKKG